MCIYAYMYVYMYEPQYNESTEVQTLGTVRANPWHSYLQCTKIILNVRGNSMLCPQ